METRLTVTLGEPEVCYEWDKDSESGQACRLLHARSGYYLHRGPWPGAGGIVKVFAVPRSVAIEMRRLVAKEDELLAAGVRP